MTLSEHLATTGKTDAQFAAIIGCERSFVSRLRRNLTKPGPAMMKKIAEHTDYAVLPNDWFSGLSQEAA